MKVFAIRDEEADYKDLAYLIYYEMDRRFYIELPDDADPWEIPLVLSSFLERGIKSINSYWSKLWVSHRIVPTDRQNLGQILKANGLNEYDEYKLLVLATGRCAQDSYYITPSSEEVLLGRFPDRFEKKIEDLIPLSNGTLLVFFRNGEVKRVDIAEMKREDRLFSRILSSDEIFKNVSIQPGGYGIYWGENVMISDWEIYEKGVLLPLSMDDFCAFLSERVVSTQEAADLLECSRQNINDLVYRGKLRPVKSEQKNNFFLKSEIEKRRWK